MSDLAAPTMGLTVREWDVLVESGLLDGQPVELLDGRKVVLSPESLSHEQIADLIADQLVSQRSAAHVRMGHALRLQTAPDEPGSDPEPDVVLTHEPRSAYLGRRVTAADAALVVEVSGSSRCMDRGPKAAAYARAGVAEYWVADITSAQVVVHRGPLSGDWRERHIEDFDVPITALCGVTVTVPRAGLSG